MAEAIPQLARRICRVTSNPDVDHMVKTLRLQAMQTASTRLVCDSAAP